ncbi:TPA: ead/Ea22-like family protein [Escherichia coli]
MNKIDYQALREAAEKATWGDWDSYKPHRGARGYEVRLSSQAIAQHVLKNNAEFIAAFNPKIALALLDERERNQQYIKSRDQENEDIALTVGKLRVELEAAKKRIAELEAEPVSQTYKSQHTQFEQVADLYEMQFDDGRTCAFHTDAQKAAQWLQACDGNRVQEYVKLERLRNALSGNYPVTPDGWISCSERMPSEEDVLVYCSDTKEQMVGFHKGKGLFQFFYMNGVEGVCEPSHWMPLPEPPQEVNRG